MSHTIAPVETRDRYADRRDLPRRCPECGAVMSNRTLCVTCQEIGDAEMREFREDMRAGHQAQRW